MRQDPQFKFFKGKVKVSLESQLPLAQIIYKVADLGEACCDPLQWKTVILSHSSDKSTDQGP